MAWCKVIFLSNAGEASERTHQLTVVATVNTVAHGAAKLSRYRAVELNSQIRDAFARVDDLVIDNGTGWAGGATGATAATVLLGKWCVDRQWQVGIQLTEEKKRARLGVE